MINTGHLQTLSRRTSNIYSMEILRSSYFSYMKILRRTYMEILWRSSKTKESYIILVKLILIKIFVFKPSSLPY